MSVIRTGQRPGAPNGARNGRSKLTEKQVRKIRATWALELEAGGPGLGLQTELAKRYGVTAPCVNQIVNRRTWRHVY